MGYIYQIRNIDNDKLYIGSTNNFSVRKGKHLYDLKNNRHGNSYLQHAFNQSPTSFRFEILQDKIPDNKLLECEGDELSGYLVNGSIDKNRCYNSTLNPARPTPSPATRDKMRKAALGRKTSPETIAKIRIAKIGRKCSKEHIEKVRQAKIGHKCSQETRIKIGLANAISNLGKKQSKEHIEKTRQIHLGRKNTPETIEKMRQSQKGNKNGAGKRSPEVCEKMKQAWIKRKENDK